MKITYLLFLLIFLLIGFGCSSIPQDKSCLPEALMMNEALRAKSIKSGVLTINYKNVSHAICCYELKNNPNRGYAWDINWGSVPLKPWGWDAEITGKQWSIGWMPNSTFVSAHWEVPIE